MQGSFGKLDATNAHTQKITSYLHAARENIIFSLC